MSEFGSQIIFKQLLDRHQRIRVPMIQRDYAQGRESEKEVRDEFLNALHGALLLEPKSELLPLNLDFIYGSVEGDEETRFLPLDGQQRLTTLFLLHWYLAWKDNQFDEFQAIVSPDGESRFSYSVRPSSKEFFDALVNYCPNSTPDNTSSLRSLITNQAWYFRYWRLDPTIQASLTMLEAIHKYFSEAEGFFQRLIDEEYPAITFQLLDLENFGLSDDLYIKMNARGKPLTTFETFKARYEQILDEQFGDETRTIGDHEFKVAEYFSRRMDTQWADFFWAHRDKNTNLYDDAVMNLFRVVALVSRDPESDSYIEDIRLLRKSFIKSSFAVFHGHGWLDRRFSETLFLLLETWSNENAEFVCQLPNKCFFDEEAVFTKVVSSPTALSLTELVQFSGYLDYLQENIDDVDTEKFQEWMRVIFNLSVNTNYDRPTDMQRSISGLKKLSKNTKIILKYFADTEKPVTGFSVSQISEESLKASLILSDDAWRALIDQAERHGYFRGQVGFLLDICGVVNERESTESVDWDTHTHKLLQQKFESYYDKASSMFNMNGLINIDKYRWERALFSIEDYTLKKGPNYSFLINSSTEPASWKRLLRDKENWQELKQFWDRLDLSKSIDEQLDSIIESSSGLELWREQFVNTPEAIRYCGRREYRWTDEHTVYLMSKSQMNGMHAELFTYCLYHNSIDELVDNEDLLPFDFSYYHDVNTTDEEPYFYLVCSYAEHRLYFYIEFRAGVFLTSIKKESIQDLPDIYTLLNEELGFKELYNRISKESNYSEIENCLTELAQGLSILVTEGEPDAE